MSSEGDEIRDAAQERYASGSAVWSQSDKWNWIKRAGIESFCRSALEDLPSDAAVLNAGAGSQLYDWMPDQAINLDRFAEQVRQLPNPVVAELEALPFEAAAFDLIVCVGPVLNYTSALEAISEMCRVLRPGGHLILHYESSDSAEHLLTRLWRRDVALLHTFNNGTPDKVWVYSHGFIHRALKRNGVHIERQSGFHIASAALLRLGFAPDIAAKGAKLDSLLRPLAFLADDIILVGRKDAKKIAGNVG